VEEEMYCGAASDQNSDRCVTECDECVLLVVSRLALGTPSPLYGRAI